jgi:SAM-dependent methyltransferase
MRLTDKSRWSQRQALDQQALRRIRAREQWMDVIVASLPHVPLDVLELGCSPGTLSAAVVAGTPWRPFGIDYSDDAEQYVESLKHVGKVATLYKGDIFETHIDRQFDVVCSFGLVEHFSGGELDRLLEIHDRYVRPGGYLVILIPNFTGYQYLWHYMFDRPDLDNHNVGSMSPKTFNIFAGLGYKTIFNDYHGVLRVWGNSGWLGTWFTGKAVAALAHMVSGGAKILSKVGLKFSGRSFAPYLLFIGQKPN